MRLVTDKFSALELCNRGDYEGAAEVLGLSVGQWPENRSEGDSEQAITLLVAGIISTTLCGIRQSGNQTVAREMLEESFRLSDNWAARAWRAWTYYWDDDLKSAIEAATEALAHDLSDIDRFRSHFLLAIIYWQQGFQQKAWDELERMVPFYENCPHVLKGKFHGQRAVILRAKGETDRALIEYECGLSFFRGRDPRCEAVTSNNLAGVYLDIGQLEQAHKYADSARKLFHQLGDKAYEAKALDQSALIFLAEGNITRAREVNAHSLVLVNQGEVLNECLATSAKIKQKSDFSENLNLANMSGNLPQSQNSNAVAQQTIAMEPLEIALQLLQSQPDNAALLFDFVILARNIQDDPVRNAQFDEVEEVLYAKTGDSNSHRDNYRRSRLVREVISDS